MYLKLNFLSVLMHYLSATLTSVSPRLLVEVSHTSCLQHSCCSIAKQHGVGCFVWRHSIASMDGIFVRYRKFISIDFSVHGPPLLWLFQYYMLSTMQVKARSSFLAVLGTMPQGCLVPCYIDWWQQALQKDWGGVLHQSCIPGGASGAAPLAFRYEDVCKALKQWHLSHFLSLPLIPPLFSLAFSSLLPSSLLFLQSDFPGKELIWIVWIVQNNMYIFSIF